MQRLLIFIYTIIYRLFVLPFKTGLAVRNPSFFLSSLSIQSNNKVEVNHGSIFNSTVSVAGKCNDINISTSVYRSKIKIFGNDNKVVLKCKYLNFAELVVRGNNCIVEIEEGATLGSGTIVCMGNHTSINIGKDTMMADNIDIWNTDSHPIFDDKNNLLNPSSSISIGDKVWLGKGVKVLKGVTIGDGAVVGMNSLVTKNIESNSLNAGMPSRQIKKDIHWKREFISNFE